jgi:DNA repair photolyase
MIISASRRTDIPAFYTSWFMNRIREGYLFVQNPFNAHKYSRVDLSPHKVDAVVFWTKNPRPILQHLDELDQKGYRYYFQFTLTGYPSAIEPSVPKIDAGLSTFKELSNKLGADRVVWRFDPIILSDITNKDFILRNFERIAKELSNYTKRVVVSFADFYKKVTNNLHRVENEMHIKFYDISLNMDQINRISSHLSEIAHKNSMQIFSCADKYELSKFGIKHGKCIDDDLIKDLFGIALHVQKDKSQRDECGCVQSQDIGQYNSCIHDCVYCYANYNKHMAHRKQSLHDPNSPFLLGNGNQTQQVHKKEKGDQLSLLRSK